MGQLNDKMFDAIFELIFDLLNEYDIGLWEDIRYVPLAEMWIESLGEAISQSASDEEIDVILRQEFRDKLEKAITGGN
jgi:hypothetical protein